MSTVCEEPPMASHAPAMDGRSAATPYRYADEQLQAEFTLAWLPEIGAAALWRTALLSAVFLTVTFQRLPHDTIWPRISRGAAMDAVGSLHQLETQPAAALKAAGDWLVYQIWRFGGVEGLIAGRAALAMLAAWVAWQLVARLVRRFTKSQDISATTVRDQTEPVPRRTMLAMAVVLAVLIWSPVTYGLLTARPRAEVDALSAGTPYFLADEMARRGIVGRCVAAADWSSYLAWRTAGRVQPLLGNVAQGALEQGDQDLPAILRGDANWLPLADAHAVRWLVVDHARHGRLYAAVADHPRCRTRYLDQQAALVEILPHDPSPGSSSFQTSSASSNPLNDVQQLKQVP